MATNPEIAQTRVREIINRLQVPVPDLSALLSLLASPLASLRLLPPRYRKHNVNPLHDGDTQISKHIPLLQRALLQHVIPTWESVLVEENAAPLLEQYFCPDPFSFISPAAGEVTLLAYSSILSLPLTGYSIRLLVRLSQEYPIDRLHTTLFSQVYFTQEKRSIAWEDAVRNIVAVPAKVANALSGKDIPNELQHAVYFDNLSTRCEVLMYSLSSKVSEEAVSSMVYLLTKLVNLGVFPAVPPTSRSQPSFFGATLMTIRRRLRSGDHQPYSAFWSSVLKSIPSILTLQVILTSLLSSFPDISPPLSPNTHQRSQSKLGGTLLRQLIGPLSPENDELWQCFIALALGRDWSEGRARMFVCWVAQVGDPTSNEQALAKFLDKAVELWSNPEHVNHSLLSRHHYLTCLILLILSCFRPNASQFHSLAFSPPFISGVGFYIGHLDPSIRRCGMLVAEVVAQHAGKKLDFGNWDGDTEGRLWSRQMRTLMAARDTDSDVDADEEGTPVESLDDRSATTAAPGDQDTSQMNLAVSQGSGYESDESMVGYASPSSSRSPSPTQVELDEIEKDPALAVGVKKIPRPVYLAQLGNLIRGPSGMQSGEDNQQADRIETALDFGEKLIRKKSGFGMELEENAVNLVYAFVGLQNNYELDNFEAKRQGALNALVACGPRKSAPVIIEEFFKNQYSVVQRYAMLNALALGARELASMTVPSLAMSPAARDRINFPSKMLPPKAHRKLIGPQEQVIQGLIEDITHPSSQGGNVTQVDRETGIVRERQLRFRRPPKITEVKTSEAVPLVPRNTRPVKAAFAEVAAEFFIIPLINRFWLFLRDEQTREERTAHHELLRRYRGGGTGLILNPMILRHFLATLAVLVHASQNAVQWLTFIAPDTLELALTLGTRPVSYGDAEEEDQGSDASGLGENEASVLTATLELIIVILHGSMELDGGRTLCLDHTTLLLGTREWAGGVFSRLEKGSLVKGGGGDLEIKLRRVSTEVLLKVEEVSSKWGRSMVDTR